MKFIAFLLLTLSVTFAIPSTEAAASTVTMTGDNVTIKYFNPDSSTELTGFGFPVNVTVAPGSSDVVSDAFPGGAFFTVNMEPTSIIVTFLQNTLFGPPSPFDGIGIFGINQTITGVTQTGGTPGIVSLFGNAILFNFAGPQVYAAGSTVTADLTFAPVPLPAGILLLGGALAGLGVTRRRAQRIMQGGSAMGASA